MSEADMPIESVEHLRDLSRLHDDWENDAACLACEWAADTIERLCRLYEQERAEHFAIMNSLCEVQGAERLPDPAWQTAWEAWKQETKAKLEECTAGRLDDEGAD